MTERIVAAAIRVQAPVADSPNGAFAVTVTLPPPARHSDLIWGFGNRVLPSDQGFLTSMGRFVGRREAAGIALDAGQADEIPLGELFSEDLW